jgi:hypothetical protein
LGQDCPFQLLESRAGVDAELLGQGLPGPSVGLQGFGLPARAVQGQHELAVETLPQRMGRHQRLQLTNQLGVATQGKLGLDRILHGGQAALLQPHHLPLAAGSQGDVGEGRPPPQPDCVAQQPCRPSWITGGQRGPTLSGQPLKAGKIELLGANVDQVAGRLGAQHPPGPSPGPGRLQHLAQVGHIHLQHATGSIGRVLAPELVDQPVRRHDLCGV